MLSTLKELDSSRFIIRKDNYDIVIPKDHKPVPLDCEVCGFMMRDYKDVSSFYSAGCCSECELQWYFANKEKWEEGWRPDQEEIDSYYNK
jgi:hypothetical protein